MSVSSRVDAVVLEELKSIGGPEFLRQVVDVFLEVQRSAVQSMLAAVEHRDAQALVNSAHQLKGSCGSVGARRAANLCLELQSHGRANRVDEANPKIALLQAELNQVIDALQALVGARS